MCILLAYLVRNSVSGVWPWTLRLLIVCIRHGVVLLSVIGDGRLRAKWWWPSCQLAVTGRRRSLVTSWLIAADHNITTLRSVSVQTCCPSTTAGTVATAVSADSEILARHRLQFDLIDCLRNDAIINNYVEWDDKFCSFISRLPISRRRLVNMRPCSKNSRMLD